VQFGPWLAGSPLSPGAITIRVARFDRVDILKLDIEGGELEALRGTDRMLADHRIALVYTEFACCPHI